MVVSAQIGICPLRQERPSPAIEAVRERSEAGGLGPEVGTLSLGVPPWGARWLGARWALGEFIAMGVRLRA